MKVQTRANILYGVLALLVALAVMARALHLFPPYIEDVIGRSFPVVLVILGLSVLLRERVPFGGLISVVVGGVLVAGVATTAFSVRQAQVRTENQIEITEEIGDEVVLLRVRLQTLTTDVEITRAPEGSEHLLRVAFAGSTENDIEQIYIEGNDGSATFTLTELQLNPVPMLEAVGRGSLLVELPPDVPVDVQVEALDGEIRLNMTGVLLERLNIDHSAGDAIVTLPAYDAQFSQPDETLGTWRIGDGALTVRIPEDVSARFDMSQSTGPDPDYDPTVYNLLFGRDVLEARNIDTAEITARYDLIVDRARLTVTVTE